uniref:Conotoxin Mr105 n=1 Tax=Conus marmoreus TaxID=42752 RepID=FX1_CONMR|nr:RecName: Full=Conotoxin Mr105; Flags: Precursor [Conus marmoreus]
MQRGAVLLGVVALLVLWPQAGAELYDVNDPDVRAMVIDGQKLMHDCAIANDYIDDPWWTLNLGAFEEKRVYHSMLSELVFCLNAFLQRRQQAP